MELEEITLSGRVLADQVIQGRGARKRWPIELSAPAPADWVDAFNETRNRNLDSSRAPAHVGGKVIVLECTEAELQNQIDDLLKKTLPVVNVAWRENRRAAAQRDAQRRQSVEVERQRTNDTIGKLNF